MDIKLAELVTKLLNEHPEDDIYLGSKSGFFFVGKPQELLSQMQDLSFKFQDYFTDCYNEADRMIIKLLNECPADDKKLYRSWKWVLAKNLETSCRYEDILERFKHLANRQVRDFRYRQDRKEGRIIVVEGDETGRFWTKDEYLKGNIPFWDEDDEEGGYDG